MQVSEIIPPLFTSLPPMYAWPEPLKRVFLTVAIGMCVSVYVLLVGGILGAGVLLLKLVLE
jgi:hypothetical protein